MRPHLHGHDTGTTRRETRATIEEAKEAAAEVHRLHAQLTLRCDDGFVDEHVESANGSNARRLRSHSNPAWTQATNSPIGSFTFIFLGYQDTIRNSETKHEHRHSTDIILHPFS